MPRHNLLQKAIVWLLWLLLWAVLAAIVGKPLLLPSPADTARAFVRLWQTGDLLRAALSSLYRIALAFGIGAALGISLSVLGSVSAWCRAFFAPLISLVAVTPVASFIVLALVWMRVGSVPVFATVLVVLPLFHASVAEGIRATDPLLLEMARAFRMRPLVLVRRVYLPSIMPHLRAAIASGMGMAWKAGVAAEVICTPSFALGTLLYTAKVYLNTDALFATTATVILLSVCVEKLIIRLTGVRGETA